MLQPETTSAKGTLSSTEPLTSATGGPRFKDALVSLEQQNRNSDELFATPEFRAMGQNTNHLPLPSAVIRALQRSIVSEEFHGYAPPLGFEELRRGILSDLALEGLTTVVTDGGAQALYHICHTFLQSGDEFVTTDPGWKWPPVFARQIGAVVVEVPVYDPTVNYRLTAERLEASLTSRTRMIYLVDPNNPLGTCVSASDMKRITELARDRQILLLHDCTYRDFASNHTLAASDYPEGTFTVYSFSKWLGVAGLRVGAVVASAELVGRLASAPPNSLGCNVISQRAAMAGLQCKKEWFPLVQSIQRENQAQIKQAVQQIPGFRLPVYPSEGNYLVIECIDAGVRPAALVELLRQHRISIRPGTYHTAAFGHRFVKVSTTVPQSWVADFCALLPKLADKARK